MKLGKKVLRVLILIWLLFFLIIAIGSYHFILGKFTSLENKHTEDDLFRANEALYQIENTLSRFTEDWAHWNDLYHYMSNQNNYFIKNNIVKSSFNQLNIDLISFWDVNHKLVFSYYINTDNNESYQYPKDLDEYFKESSLFFTHQPPASGIALVEHRLMLMAASKITDSFQKLPSRGTIIVGRMIDDKVIQNLNEITKMKLSIFSVEKIIKSHQLSSYYKNMIDQKKEMMIFPINDHELLAYHLIRDISGKPIALLQLTQQRNIYQMGIKSVHYYLLIIFSIGILFSYLMLVFIKKSVINRLQKMDSTIREISNHKQMSLRLNSSGSDEISYVSGEINKMLNIIQASQEDLEHRVYERTKELNEKNIQLNNEINERKKTELALAESKEKLSELARYDDITSLPNRIFFNEILNRALIQSKRHKEKLALLFIDLSQFKKINDAFGHPTGDVVLKLISQRFQSLLRSNDTIARLSGDEFIILLNHIGDSKYAGLVADKIIKSCESPIAIKALELFVNVSVGISIFPDDGTSLEDLEKNADMAMHKAKLAGGSTYAFYQHEMELAAHEYIKMESLLRKAIQNNEFRLYFQPQMTLKDGSIKHAEVLIRWINPEMGLINPDHFIPLAEKTGLIIPIGEWAIREACRINKEWQNLGFEPISIAVNVSAKQFYHQDVASIIESTLKETGLSPEFLEIEITESAVMENVELTIEKLTAIHRMGVRISIDDFGTGYTSINYLRRFPVNILKIDQTFVKGISTNQNDRAIISAVIDLAHHLNLEVIAEGVETIEQIQFLIDNKCDFIQGYYFSKPLPADEMIAFFKEKGLNGL